MGLLVLGVLQLQLIPLLLRLLVVLDFLVDLVVQLLFQTLQILLVPPWLL